MSIDLEDLKAGLYDKRMRARLRKDPQSFLGDSSPYKDAKECKVITSSKEVTYVTIPHHTTLPLSKITAGTGRGYGCLSTFTSTVGTASTSDGKN